LRQEGIERFLEKYSIAIVSNSLRSNLTGNFENKGKNIRKFKIINSLFSLDDLTSAQNIWIEEVK